MRRGTRTDDKKWMALGKPYTCQKCGWVLRAAASNGDIKRNIVCECLEIPITTGDTENGR